jgi:hypothetical protein
VVRVVAVMQTKPMAVLVLMVLQILVAEAVVVA